MTPFGSFLQTWRKTRRYSQLHLAGEAGVSARHLSFLETGRAQPSREMVERLGEALARPLGARNQLLSYAGFAARYSGYPWDADEMAPIRAAVAYMLHRHAPYPALALDRLWTVVRLNAPAEALYAHLGVGVGDSLLDLMVSEMMPERVENWPQVAHQAAHQLWNESAAQGGVPDLDRAAAHLAQQARHSVELGEAGLGPVTPTIYRYGDLRLSLFSTLSHFSTPRDAMLEDFKLELYFPADAGTKEALHAFAAAGPGVESETEQDCRQGKTGGRGERLTPPSQP
ncbi:MAG: helix-turn-helix domain-containing protein [Bacteroidota bacterium]